MRNFYTLDAKGEPELAYKSSGDFVADIPNMMKLYEWKEDHRKERQVKQEQIGPWWVSTVFLCEDYGLHYGKKPIYWETMVFKGTYKKSGPSLDDWTERCGGKRKNAIAQHDGVAARVRKLLKQSPAPGSTPGRG